MLNMACTLFRLTPEEALRGFTHHGAKALGLHERGRLVAGQRADFAVWPLAEPHELAYWLGQHPVPSVVVGGLERPQPRGGRNG
jgi:imidazolonepropionase